MTDRELCDQRHSYLDENVEEILSKLGKVEDCIIGSEKKVGLLEKIRNQSLFNKIFFGSIGAIFLILVPDSKIIQTLIKVVTPFG